MEMVIPIDDAAICGIAIYIDAALVVGLLHGAVHLVEFDQVIVALDAHHAARAVVQEIMRHTVAHALELNRRRVGPVDAPELVNPAVFDEVPAGCQCFTVAADDFAGAPSDRMDVAAE